jgi:hypothetical protein
MAPTSCKQPKKPDQTTLATDKEDATKAPDNPTTRLSSTASNKSNSPRQRVVGSISGRSAGTARRGNSGEPSGRSPAVSTVGAGLQYPESSSRSWAASVAEAREFLEDERVEMPPTGAYPVPFDYISRNQAEKGKAQDRKHDSEPDGESLHGNS